MTTTQFRHIKVSPKEHEALTRLLSVAVGDTGQGRKVADFLLAWWNAGTCGGFDLTTPWGLDDTIVQDVITVFGLAARSNSYPDVLGYENEFKRIVHIWHRELKD